MEWTELLKYLPFVLLIAGALVFLYFTNNKNKKSTKQRDVKSSNESTQKFVNVSDIRNGYLFTGDGFAFAYAAINPISVDLYSGWEKRKLCEDMTMQLSQMQYPFKLLKLTRTLDVTDGLDYLNDIYRTTESEMQKILLKESIDELNNIALTASAVERLYYAVVWIKYTDQDSLHELDKRINNLMTAYETCGIATERLNDKRIAQMVNQFNNPTTAHLEAYDDVFTDVLMWTDEQ